MPSGAEVLGNGAIRGQKALRMTGRLKPLHAIFALPVPATLPWLRVRAPAPAQTLRLATTLGRGEQEVLALALEILDVLVLMDDGQARRVGRLLGLTMTGTVGILARATREGLLPQLAPMLDRLAALGFRLSAEARATALRLVGEGW
jgi:predicted nucleic acid-binding protein